ncbi:MAG: hypothetical protein A2521_00670 [Deltaproteobacteria bacterium RIFOXYD12_FULL_57_12]|nr:MAG: hypothetical protein A2521_00670 [Deltaproteobacteria bacterium RIFOXYD12_FULL_57_12]
MINDYYVSFSSTTVDKFYCNPRQKAANRMQPATGHQFFLKAIGVLVVLTLVTGVASTMVYGQRVRIALDEIGRQSTLSLAQTNQHQTLLAERDRLLSRAHVEKAAKKLGLFPPTTAQIRRP